MDCLHKLSVAIFPINKNHLTHTCGTWWPQSSTYHSFIRHNPLYPQWILCRLWCIILLEIWIISFFCFVGRGPGFFLFHTVLMRNVYCIYFIISCLSKIHNPTVTRKLLKAQWRRYAQNGTLCSALDTISSAVPLSDKYSSNSNLQIHAYQTSGWEPASTITRIQQMCHVK